MSTHSRASSRLDRARNALLVLAFAATVAPTGARAQSVNVDFPVTDGTVYASVIANNTLYLGGNFSWLGAVTGSFVALDANTATRSTTVPRVDGAVNAAVSDGAGGWYLGGSFQNVAGVPRNRLAHVLADGSLAPWNPGADADVMALALNGTTVIAGGAFAHAGGAARSALAAIDATTGVATAWNPNATGTAPVVRALAVNAGAVYVGGRFDGLGGAARPNAAQVDLATALATAWNPAPDDEVDAMVLLWSRVFLGGAFSNAGGAARAYAACVNTTTGTATAWNPNAGATVTSMSPNPAGTMILGGNFLSVHGQSRWRIAEVDTSSGNVTAWAPIVNSGVTALTTTSRSVFVGGGFSQVNGTQRNCLAEISLMTGTLTQWNPGANDAIGTLTVLGSTVAVGGAFSSVGGLACGNLAAIDLATSRVKTWNPVANHEVDALAASGNTVYAGGAFTSVGGAGRNHLAALDGTTGLATAWNPNVLGDVNALVTRTGLVYAGGAFTSVGGQPRGYLAAIDSATGSPTPWNPNLGGITFPYVQALAVSGNTLFAGGRFTTANLVARAHLASFDASSGALLSWNPGTDGNVGALATDGTTVWVGGDFLTLAGSARHDVGAVGASNGAITAWNPNADGIVSTLVSANGVVYAGGAFTNVGGSPRRSVAALDPASGLATTWNGDALGPVFAIAPTASLVALGGEFSSVQGLARNSIASVSVAPATTYFATATNPVAGASLAIGAPYQLRWSAGGGSGVQSVDLYLSRTGPSGPWTLIANGLANTGRFVWTVTGPVTSGTAYLRVDARDWSGLVLSSAPGGPFSIVNSAADVAPAELAFALGPLAPNPVRGDALVSFTVPVRARVSLGVYDVAGRAIATLAEGEHAPGRHAVRLDASAMRPGLYFVRLAAPGVERTQRCVVVR